MVLWCSASLLFADRSSDLKEQHLHLSMHSACCIPLCKMESVHCCSWKCLMMFNVFSVLQLEVCHFVFSWCRVLKASLVRGVFSARDYENNENDGQRLKFGNPEFHSPWYAARIYFILEAFGMEGLHQNMHEVSWTYELDQQDCSRVQNGHSGDSWVVRVWLLLPGRGAVDFLLCTSPSAQLPAWLAKVQYCKCSRMMRKVTWASDLRCPAVRKHRPWPCSPHQPEQSWNILKQKAWVTDCHSLPMLKEVWNSQYMSIYVNMD